MAFQNPRYEQRGQPAPRDTSLYMPAVWAYGLPPQLRAAAGVVWGLNQGYRFWPLTFEHDFQLYAYTVSVEGMGLCTQARMAFALYHIDFYGGKGTAPRLAIVAGTPSEEVTFTAGWRMIRGRLTVPKVVPRGNYMMAAWLDGVGKGLPDFSFLSEMMPVTMGAMGRISLGTLARPPDWPGTLYWNEHTDPDYCILVAGVLSEGGYQMMEVV